MGRLVSDDDDVAQLSPAKRGSEGQWGAVGVAEGGRTPLLAWLQWHGQAWLGWRAAGEALITGSCSFALFRGRG